MEGAICWGVSVHGFVYKGILLDKDKFTDPVFGKKQVREFIDPGSVAVAPGWAAGPGERSFPGIGGIFGGLCR